MDTYLTWAEIGTISGCTVATALITQYVKSMFDKMPTQLLSYIVALILIIGSSVFAGEITWESVCIAPINAIIVSLASNGSFDAVKRIKK